MRNRRSTEALWKTAAGAGLLVFSIQGIAAAQCAMCRTALTNSDEGRRWALGIDHGILFLLAAPFLIVARVLFAIYRPEITAAAESLWTRSRVPLAKLRKRNRRTASLQPAVDSQDL